MDFSVGYRKEKMKGKSSRPKLTPIVVVVDDDDEDDDDGATGLGFDDIVPTTASAAGRQRPRPTTTTREEEEEPPPRRKRKDRYRDPPSPKSVLDRDALIEALDSRGIALKVGQLDALYQALHRAGYPPLGEFAAGLLREDGGGGGGGGDAAAAADGHRDDDEEEEDRSVVVVDDVVSAAAATVVPFGTKNAISSRPGRRRASRLPSSLLSFLSDDATSDFATLTSSVSSCRTSEDGSTTKIVVKLHDGHDVESVVMRHGRSRVTMCVSSQVGCAMGCTFCATGTMGMRGNLSTGEILEQLVHGSRILATSEAGASRVTGGGIETAAVVGAEDEDDADDVDDDAGGGGGGERRSENGRRRAVANRRRRRGGGNNRMDLVRNVVFMGMGEPLNNYDNVLGACRAMIDRRLWNLAHNRVTVSTVGVPSRMRDLTRDLPEVNLALSLHAPDQSTRERIVPAARGTPIESLIEALDGHMMALAKRRGEQQLLAADNPQGSDRGGGATIGDGGDGDGAVGAEFDLEERKAASKRKRAMIEYIMRK